MTGSSKLVLGLRSAKGATVIEYSLLTCLITLVSIVVLQLLGTNAAGPFVVTAFHISGGGSDGTKGTLCDYYPRMCSLLTPPGSSKSPPVTPQE